MSTPETADTSHLVALPSSTFSVWKWVCLRSTGFEAKLVDEIAAPRSAHAADEVLALRAEEDPSAIRAAFEGILAEESRDVRARLHRILADPRFELALRWQSPAALEGSIAWLRRQAPEIWNRRVREGERLAARYLQRYALKNDSIGFFGPLGWGTFEPSAATSFLPGRALLRSSTVRFEGWSIDALIHATARDDTVLDVAPHRLPGFYLAGSEAYFPERIELARRMGLDPKDTALALREEQLSVLGACDGVRTAREIAGAFPEGRAYALLEELRSQGLVGWSFELPLALMPDRALLGRVEGIADPALRASWRRRIAPLVEARDAIEAAEGPSALASAMRKLDGAFEEATGRSARRAEGKTYAARTLVHLDTVRDVTLVLGPEVLAALGPPLGLVLESARWFTRRVACELAARFLEIHRRLARASGTASPSLQAFATLAMPLIENDEAGVFAASTAELQRRWAQILLSDGSHGEVQHRASDIEEAAQVAFAATGPGWELARYVSPDVLIAAPDVHSIARGDFQLVLGEVHLYNTLSRALFVDAHPEPLALRQARTADLPRTCVIPVPSKRHNLARTAVTLVGERDVRFVYEDAPTGVPASQTISIGELVVEEHEGVLSVQTRDERFSISLIEFFGHTIANACMALPPLLPSAPFTPRITIDRLVVQRATWEVPASVMGHGAAVDRAERFLRARRLQRDRGMPRRVFVRFASGEKPVYVDFESPILTDVLGHVASGLVSSGSSGSLRIAELLPAIESLWLTDAPGARYSSELRIVALDPAAPVGRGISAP